MFGYCSMGIKSYVYKFLAYLFYLLVCVYCEKVLHDKTLPNSLLFILPMALS